MTAYAYLLVTLLSFGPQASAESAWVTLGHSCMRIATLGLLSPPIQLSGISMPCTHWYATFEGKQASGHTSRGLIHISIRGDYFFNFKFENNEVDEDEKSTKYWLSWAQGLPGVKVIEHFSATDEYRDGDLVTQKRPAKNERPKSVEIRFERRTLEYSEAYFRKVVRQIISRAFQYHPRGLVGSGVSGAGGYSE